MSNTSPRFNIPPEVLIVFSLFIIFLSCQQKPVPSSGDLDAPDVKARFTLMKPEETGVNFINALSEDSIYNIFEFEYLYNGGGVAAGDVNGDSLPDLYFSSSRFSNKLFLNLGQFKFIDVTEAAGVSAKEGFKTGVAMADMNGDGRLDIISCRTSKLDDGLKNNFVFINKGNKEENGVRIPLFENEAKQLGLEDNSNTNHACFFDYDRDGDLDLFLVNHKITFKEATTLRLKQMEDGSRVRITDPETPFEANRLYRNDSGKFSDVTKQAGMWASAFGLSATAADFNQDGWVDLFVANDYIEPDFLYINNKNGTFTDRYATSFRVSSHSSMGSDAADINNDGLIDLAVMDMKAEDPVRYKELLNAMSYDRYNLLVEYGYGRQAARNVLQLNNGNQTYSEIGQFAGMAATDWSWSVLLADFDNDSWKDIYITNGYRKEVTNLDYINYSDSIRQAIQAQSGTTIDINTIFKNIPEQKLPNYLYLHDGRLSFINGAKQAGIDQPSYSNGSAYADLDRDGDLDLIVNNLEDPAFIYRNDISGQHWFQISVSGDNRNTLAIGAYARLFAAGKQQLALLTTSKGFFSTSEPLIHFGLGDATMIDSVILHWPDGYAEILTKVNVDQRIGWKKGMGKEYHPGHPLPAGKLFDPLSNLIPWKHSEDVFVDVKRERLLPYFFSAEGPCLAIGDVNGDHRMDVYTGNGRGFPSSLFIQTPDETFLETKQNAFVQDAIYEDCGAVFEDFDGDQDMDLMVVSGGNDLALNDPGYMTRYYSNDGKGGFTRDPKFPIIRTNAGAVLAMDYDRDGDKDVFVGGRATPGGFPTPPKSYLLKNDSGSFIDVTAQVFPELNDLGMLTDMAEGDLDGDGQPEIFFTGEWMTPRIFSFVGNHFAEKTSALGFTSLDGWWKCVTLADLDADGDLDVLAGNMGTNHRLHASPDHPIILYANDFDGNGSTDPIMCFNDQDRYFPFAGRDMIISQVPVLKKRFIKYSAYARATIQDLFSKEQIEKSTKLYARTFRTLVWRNNGGKFESVSLPDEVQLNPVFDILVDDYNADGRADILMAGNFLYAETETSEMDAGNGILLVQKEDGTFDFIPNREHGYWAQGEVRDLRSIALADGRKVILTGNNKGPIQSTMVEQMAPHE